MVYRRAAAQVAKSTGGHYPAPVKALEAVRRGLARKLDDGLRLMAAWVEKVGARSSREFENIEIRRRLPSAWSHQ